MTVTPTPTRCLPDELPQTLVGDMVHLYKILPSTLKDLHSYLWDTTFFDNIIKLTQSPMDCVVGLYYLPVNVATPAPVALQVGNTSTNKVAVYPVEKRFAQVSCGSVSIDPFWGSFADYLPYTTIDLYLPYVGTIRLDTDIAMGATIGVSYKVDMLSGAAVAIVTANGNVINQINTSLMMQLPISGNDLTNNLLATVKSGVSLVSALGSGNILGAVSSAADIVAAQKQHPVEQADLAGACGFVGNRTPFVRIANPILSQPSSFGKYKGNMIYATGKLSTFSGYTVIDSIHLDDFPCYDAEKEALEQILKSGVII